VVKQIAFKKPTKSIKKPSSNGENNDQDLRLGGAAVQHRKKEKKVHKNDEGHRGEKNTVLGIRSKKIIDRVLNPKY